MQLVASYRNTMAGAAAVRARMALEHRNAELEAALVRERQDHAARLARLKAEATAAVTAANSALRRFHRLEALKNGERPALPPMSLDRIARRICRVFRVTKTDLISARRTHDIIPARHAFCYWACRMSGKSTPQIGRWLGNRDHTTILHGRDSYVEKRAKMGRTLRVVR